MAKSQLHGGKTHHIFVQGPWAVGWDFHQLFQVGLLGSTSGLHEAHFRHPGVLTWGKSTTCDRGNKTWNNTFVSHVAACTMKGAREYRRNRRLASLMLKATPDSLLDAAAKETTSTPMTWIRTLRSTCMPCSNWFSWLSACGQMKINPRIARLGWEILKMGSYSGRS